MNFTEDETIIYFMEIEDGEKLYLKQGEDEILINRDVAIELAKEILSLFEWEEIQ